jgi:signal peptidase I
MILRLARRIGGIAVTVAVVGLAVVLLLPALLGYGRYAIDGGSMSGTYEGGSLVYAKPVAVGDLERGDVITYAPPAGETSRPLVTHRIVSIELGPDGRRVFRTKGDANAAADPWTFTLDGESQPRAAFSIPYAGHVLTALSEREVRMALIAGPAVLIVLLVLAGILREARGAGREAQAEAVRSSVPL